MLPKDLPQIEHLRKRPARQVKGRLAGLARDVRAAGCIAVTERGKVELVFMDVEVYRQLAALVNGTEERHRASASEPTAEVDK